MREIDSWTRFFAVVVVYWMELQCLLNNLQWHESNAVFRRHDGSYGPRPLTVFFFVFKIYFLRCKRKSPIFSHDTIKYADFPLGVVLCLNIFFFFKTPKRFLKKFSFIIKKHLFVWVPVKNYTVFSYNVLSDVQFLPSSP